TLTSSDLAASLPSPHSFTADDLGTFQFAVTLKTAGPVSVTAADGSLSNTKPGIAVGPAAADTLAVTGFPTTVTAGNAGTVTVTVRDQFGNTATGYLGTVDVTSDNPNITVTNNHHAFTAG